jgi:hypothetical protein
MITACLIYVTIGFIVSLVVLIVKPTFLAKSVNSPPIEVSMMLLGWPAIIVWAIQQWRKKKRSN